MGVRLVCRLDLLVSFAELLIARRVLRVACCVVESERHV